MYKGIIIFTKDTETGLICAHVDRIINCECETPERVMEYCRYIYAGVMNLEVIDYRIVDMFTISGCHKLSN